MLDYSSNTLLAFFEDQSKITPHESEVSFSYSKQDGSGLEYMISGAGMGLNALIRDMFVLYFQKSSKQHT